jgi:DNA-binding CsgD family transcriptional regulator
MKRSNSGGTLAPQGTVGDIDDSALARGMRLQLELWQRAKKLPGWKRPPASAFYELALLIHDFRRGKLADLFALAKAIHWNPANDSGTRRLFEQWRRDVPIQPGEPDAYTQLVVTALTLMRHPKDGVQTLRDRTPQPLRRGRRWVTGQKKKLVPLDMQAEMYVWWFRNEVTRIIKREILRVGDSSARTDFEGHETVNGRWMPSPAEQREYRTWLEKEARDTHPSGRVTQTFDGGPVMSSRLRQLERKVRRAGLALSPLQQDILNLAANDPYLKDYREIAERLGRSRDTVKNAVLRITRKL